LARPQLYIIASPQDEVTTRTVDWTGNGFIISSDGYIVTNAHLLKGDETDLKDLFAEDAAVDAMLAELDALEQELGFQLTNEEVDRFFAAAGTVITNYLTVSDARSKTQVYTGNIIDKAREGEGGLTAETVKVGDPFDVQEETGKDIAIIKINASNLPAVRLGDESSVRDGDKVTALGFLTEKSTETAATELKEDKPTLVTGSIAGRRSMEGGWSVLQMQIPLEPGSSGSPILNSSGEVVGVMTLVTFEDQDGGERTIETENFAIPASVVKEFMSQSNVTASESKNAKTYREGVDLFAGQHYKAAKNKFEEVKESNSDFPYIQDLIAESQSNIDRGLNKSTFPWILILILVLAIAAIAVVLILVLVILPKRRKGPGPGAGMPGGPAGGAPGPGEAGGDTPEAPAAPTPGAPGGAPQTPAGPSPETPEGAPPGPPPGTPMPGSPEDRERK
jgi:S1-C subfamily serine protease